MTPTACGGGCLRPVMQQGRAEAGLRKQWDSEAPDPTRVTIEANPISAFHLTSPTGTPLTRVLGLKSLQNGTIPPESRLENCGFL